MVDTATVENCIRITNPVKSFDVIASNTDILSQGSKLEKRSWMIDLNNAIFNWQEKKQKENQADGTAIESNLANYMAPIWIPDSSCKTCYRCASSFTVFKRRVWNSH